MIADGIVKTAPLKIIRDRWKNSNQSPHFHGVTDTPAYLIFCILVIIPSVLHFTPTDKYFLRAKK